MKKYKIWAVISIIIILGQSYYIYALVNAWFEEQQKVEFARKFMDSYMKETRAEMEKVKREQAKETVYNIRINENIQPMFPGR